MHVYTMFGNKLTQNMKTKINPCRKILSIATTSNILNYFPISNRNIEDRAELTRESRESKNIVISDLGPTDGSKLTDGINTSDLDGQLVSNIYVTKSCVQPSTIDKESFKI